MARIGGRPRSSIEGGSEESSDLFVQALARGLTILTLFDVEHPEWGLDEISRKTGISKTTAYRMLRTLEWKGFLAFDPETERYHIGPATVPGAYLTLSYVGFARSTHPIVERLAAATGETVELAVEGSGGAVVVDQVATSHPFKPNLPIGRVLRNLANSTMKTFAAYHTQAERERLLRGPQLKLTPNTITDPARIVVELDRVVREGLAYDFEEQDVGVSAVSAPVFGPDGGVRAVISVVAPAERFGARERKRKAEAVKKAAAELSRHLSQTTAP
ncbi:MAG: IclR family transcriptional regulator [Actinobacteria bacterium]|nr:IclR family transcriptional regulator [Actinomycetota bacterium]